MSSFETATGSLYVGESAEGNEHIENPEGLYSHAVFIAENAALVFKSGIGRYYPVGDESFGYEDGTVRYFPYRNETTVEVAYSPDTDDLTRVHEEVEIEFASVDGDLFIRSQNEITAYAPNYLIVNDEVYEHGQLFMRDDGSSDQDAFLGLEAVDGDAVYVENLRTGFRVPKAYDDVADCVENDEHNGTLRVHESDDTMETVANALK